MNQYEERVVVFIDILGFRSLIDDTTHNPELVNKIVEVTQSIYRRRAFAMIRTATTFQEGSNVGIPTEIAACNHTPRIYTFSDHIVYSLPADPAGLAIAIYACHQVYGDIAQNFNLLMRGAITVGSLYDDQTCIFGPALVEAYDLETNEAKVPRIILSDGAKTLMKRFNEIKVKDPKGYISYPQAVGSKIVNVFSPIPKILIDSDNKSFVDVFNMSPSWYSKIPHPSNASEDIFLGRPSCEQWISKLSEITDYQLSIHQENESIKEKYMWVKKWIHINIKKHNKKI